MGKNLEINIAGAKIEKSNIVPKNFYFLVENLYSFNASRAITSFWISEVPSPMVHNFESR